MDALLDAGDDLGGGKRLGVVDRDGEREDEPEARLARHEGREEDELREGEELPLHERIPAVLPGRRRVVL